MVRIAKADLGGQGNQMTEQRLVVLFGDSLFMDTVEARLEDNQELGVMRIHSTVADVMGRLKSLCPDFVIVDVNTYQSKFALPFLQEQPGMPYSVSRRDHQPGSHPIQPTTRHPHHG